MSEEFQYTQIEGSLSLEEATAKLVSTAQRIQKDHTLDSAKYGRLSNEHRFDKQSHTAWALLMLIKDYIEQAPWPDRPIRVRFQKDEETYYKVVTGIFKPTDGGIIKLPKSSIEEEGPAHFIVEYENQDEFNKAISSFDGLVEYEILE